MSAKLTQEESLEAIKILKYLKKMETVVRTSVKAEQKARVEKDISQYKEKLKQFFPNIGIEEKSIDGILSSVKAELAFVLDGEEKDFSQGSEETEESLLSQIPVKKAGPNCNYPEVNLSFSVLEKVTHLYFPLLSEPYFKLDYSYEPKRADFQHKLERALRSIASFADMLDAQSGGELGKLQERASQIRNHSARKLLMENDVIFKELVSFLSPLLEDMKVKEDLRPKMMKTFKEFRFGSLSSLKKETLEWRDRTIFELISEFKKICVEIIEHLALPSVKGT